MDIGQGKECSRKCTDLGLYPFEFDDMIPYQNETEICGDISAKAFPTST